MNGNEMNRPESRAAEGPEMIEAMRQGVLAALGEHKHLGNAVVVWDRESNQVVQVRAEDIAIPEIEAASDEPATLTSAS